MSDTNKLWSLLEFRESPYNTSPLSVAQDDVPLLIGRDDESIQLCTELEASDRGVIVLSGVPGVGKTSFFNVQQYLIESGEALFGPKLLAARSLCPVQPGDDARTLAQRALHALCRSVEAFCSAHNEKMPEQIRRISSWLRSEQKTDHNLGITILGCGGQYGRSTDLPPASSASFESLADAIECISSEIVTNLSMSGCFVALDNIENLDDETLGSLLISFRDTLFRVPNIWWVLIGQSGLGSLIQALDPRVFERISGSGIEISPLELDELQNAIDIRVKTFHDEGEGSSPLSENTHRVLFEASNGEIRFVFKYANSICTKFVEDIRKEVVSSLKGSPPKKVRSMIEERVPKVIGRHLAKNQISEEQAEKLLKTISKQEFTGLALRSRDKKVLQKLGENGRTRPKEYQMFGFNSTQDFYSNYIARYLDQNLLFREQEGKAVFYRLRGIARLAHRYNFLEGQ